MFSNKKQKAQKLHNEAQALGDNGDEEKAIELYLQAIELDPKKPESFYNLGLIYKYRNDWEKSFQYNELAYQLDNDDESAKWNLAIAATALGKWDIVRKIWAECGIQLDDNVGPINMNFGMTPIRLNPSSSAEVVWATRIDPVRTKIDSIPYQESGFSHGDIVLNDGAAVGERVSGGGYLSCIQCFGKIRIIKIYYHHKKRQN